MEQKFFPYFIGGKLDRQSVPEDLIQSTRLPYVVPLDGDKYLAELVEHEGNEWFYYRSENTQKEEAESIVLARATI